MNCVGKLYDQQLYSLYNQYKTKRVTHVMSLLYVCSRKSLYLILIYFALLASSIVISIREIEALSTVTIDRYLLYSIMNILVTSLNSYIYSYLSQIISSNFYVLLLEKAFIIHSKERVPVGKIIHMAHNASYVAEVLVNSIELCYSVFAFFSYFPKVLSVINYFSAVDMAIIILNIYVSSKLTQSYTRLYNEKLDAQNDRLSETLRVLNNLQRVCSHGLSSLALNKIKAYKDKEIAITDDAVSFTLYRRIMSFLAPALITFVSLFSASDYSNLIKINMIMAKLIVSQVIRKSLPIFQSHTAI